MPADTVTLKPAESEKGAESRGVLTMWSIEEELFALRSLAPEKLADLPAIFEKSVLSMIYSLLDRRDAPILLSLLRDTDLGSQYEVFTALDNLDHRCSALLKRAISDEFHARVHTAVKTAIGSRASPEDITARSESLYGRLGV